MKTKTIRYRFKNSRNFYLDARLDMPVDYHNITPSHFIIFCHCFTCTKETITTYRLSHLLAMAGFAVLRFDFTGLGGSEGKFENTTFETMQDDLRCAYHFLTQNYQTPSYLMGHSLGGTVALSLASQYSSLQGLVTVASPAQAQHVLHHFGATALAHLAHNKKAKFEVAGQWYDISPAFVRSVKAIKMSALLKNVQTPTLVCSVENDSIVSHQNALEIQQMLEKNTDLYVIENSDHLISNKQITTKLSQKIVQWLTQH